MMKFPKILVIYVTCNIILIVSCNNSYEDASPFEKILSQQPYASLTDSLKKNPVNPELFYRRGLLLKKNNIGEPALADFQKAWSLSKKEEYAIAVSNILLQKNPDSAVQFLNEALKSFPKSIFLKLNLAQVYSDQNNSYEELNVLNEILLDAPTEIDALMMKAEVFEKMNNKTESISTLQKAYELAPFDVELCYNLAFKYAENKNPKVLALCDSLIRMDSSRTNAEPYYFKAVFYSNTGNSAKAIDLYNKAIQHDYYFLDAYLEKGSIFYDQKQYNEALKVFQLASTISPTFASAYFWMGKCQQALGNKQEAKLNYERAYALDKSLTEAKEKAENL